MRHYFILMLSILAYSLIAQQAQAAIYISYNDRPARHYSPRIVHNVHHPVRSKHFTPVVRYAPVREVIVVRPRPHDLSCDRPYSARYNHVDYHDYY